MKPTRTPAAWLTGLLLGAGVVAVIAVGLWGPLVQTLRKNQVAESERLLDLFDPPLAEAIARGNDLGRIDELRRLRKLNGVVSAEASVDAVPTPLVSRALFFEGRRVGWLGVRLTDDPTQRAIYTWIERAGTLITCFGALGAFAGWDAGQRKRKHLLRLRRIRSLHQQRHDARETVLRQQIEHHMLSWTGQAMAFVHFGLILLDRHQIVRASNPRALAVLQISPPIQGTHWLDLQPSPDWLTALQRSLASPGERIPGPAIISGSDVSILTLSPDATWIVLCEELPMDRQA